MAKSHVSPPPKLMGNCLTWYLAAEERRLYLSLPQLFIHTRWPSRVFLEKAQRRRKQFQVSLKMFLESGEDGCQRGDLREEKSCVQAERKRRQPADLGAPSPSERSAGGVRLLGRTRGGAVEHQIPDSEEMRGGCCGVWEAARDGHRGPWEGPCPAKRFMGLQDRSSL